MVGERIRTKIGTGVRGKEKQSKANRASHESESSLSLSSESSSSNNEAHLLNTKHVKVSRALITRIQSYVGCDTKGSPSTILLDSGATAHMTPCRDWFIPRTFKPLNPPRKIRFGDKSYCDATGIGSISLPNEMDKSSTSPMKLNGVLYAPAFSLTLISVRKLNKIRLYSSFTIDDPEAGHPRKLAIRLL